MDQRHRCLGHLLVRCLHDFRPGISPPPQRQRLGAGAIRPRPLGDPSLMDAEIIIVSGLPRSGTSLMMQMLDRGGVPVITDQIRAADTDNPRGYYEFEKVKKLREDTSWLPAIRG